MAQYNLELWPGYVTSIRQHEHDIMLCAEISYKVIRLDTVYQLFRTCRGIDEMKAAIIGQTIITDYNNTTYRISDVDVTKTPMSTFDKKGEQITYSHYYKTRYNIQIQDMKQPLLVSKATARQIRGGSPEEFYLIPELSRLTGITDKMRNDFRLMKDMSAYTRVDPRTRQAKLMDFNKRLHSAPESMAALKQFELTLDRNLVQFQGRRLPEESIEFNKVVKGQAKADWTNDLRHINVFTPCEIKRWTLVVPRRCMDNLNVFLPQLFKASNGLNIRMAQPTIVELDHDGSQMYAQTLDQKLATDTQMLMAVVPNDNADRYAAIKKKCSIDRAVPSQVIVEKTMIPRNGNVNGLLSIATKVAIQISTKMGCAPWKLKLPISGLMVIGFDVCHDTRDRSKSFGAFIASMDQSRSDVYYSAAVAHTNGEELSNSFGSMTRRAIQCYIQVHNELPKKIIVYRDGVGDGQFEFVLDHEVGNLRRVLQEIYDANNASDKLKLAFLIVTKRINTRVFNGPENPPAGTVIDDVITMPERYDFYLVAQNVNQGTATPTNYNVIYDNSGLNPDQMQRLTFKLCHLYYNWTGTVRVPAVCQYAHKLSLLVGQYFHAEPNQALGNKLYFL